MPFNHSEETKKRISKALSGKKKPRNRSPYPPRFWKNVDENGPICPSLGSRCWVWTAGKYQSGYGAFNRLGYSEYAHRVSWEMHYGDILTSDVLHKCDNPSCVNPAHLFLGTADMNSKDMVSKGRSNRGEDRPLHKLSEIEVLEIRHLYKRGVVGCGYISLGRRFGVGQGAIRDAVLGITWRHIQ